MSELSAFVASGQVANGNKSNSHGMTPLLLASRRGAVEDVEKLLKTKTGGDVNCTDDRGFSGLMYAARDGFTKVVEVLIKL